MDFEAKGLKRFPPFLIEERTLKVFNTPDGRLYSDYLIEEEALEKRVSNENFRGRDANRRNRLKRLKEDLIPCQHAKILELLRDL